MASLFSGAGLRLLECLRLRVQDIDFASHQILVRAGKGNTDRRTMRPASVKEPLAAHIEHVRQPPPPPPPPSAWGWHGVFPASQLSLDPRSGAHTRHHVHESVLQRAVKEATRKAGLTKAVSCHTLRHSFATHLLEDGYDIRTIQELLGHQDVKATMIYTHVLNRGGKGVYSPIDRL